MDISKEVAFFDTFEAEHGDYDVLGEARLSPAAGPVRATVAPRPGERASTSAAAPGRSPGALSAFDLDLTGIDISPRSVADRGPQIALPSATSSATFAP